MKKESKIKILLPILAVIIVTVLIFNFFFIFNNKSTNYQT